MHTTESLKVSNTYFIVFTVHLCLILIGDVLDNKRFHKNYTEAVLHQKDQTDAAKRQTHT